MDLDELARRWAPTHPRLKAAGMPPWLEDDEDEDDKAKAEAPLTSGVMIAFYPSPDVASALALQVQDTSLPEGATPEEPEELHLTLAYFGKLGEGFQEASSADLVEAARTWAQRQAPVRCSTSGIGIFDTPDGMVTWASVDGPDLSRMRHELVTELGQAGLQAANDHGFTPHITLCWADCRNAQLSKQELVFSTVSVVIAGVRTDIPLGVPSNDEDMSKLDSLGRPKTSAVITEPESAPAPKVREEAHSGDWSFVTTVGQRTVVTASASTSATWDKPLSSNPHMLWIQGRFVGAETPNRNNAYWASSDLEIGQPTVSYGPLNWLHEERHIIGAIADSRFIPRRGGVEAAAETADPHIVVAANIWRWIYPEEASVIEMASEAGAMAISMECTSEKVGCVGDKGCGREYSYEDYLRGLTCDCVQERASVRRFINPTFLGGGIIVPPSRPGWADADMRVLASNQASDAFDQAGRPDMPVAQWDQIVAGAVKYATMLA